MTRYIPLVLALLILHIGAKTVVAAPARFLDAELKDLLDKVTDALDKDVALKGRTISLGRIGSDKLPDSNYGPELRRLFQDRLKGKLVINGLFTIIVAYDLFDSETDVAAGNADGTKMKVLIVRVIIKDDKTKELFNKSVEINESADIARVLGQTVAPPPNGTQDQRNKKIKDFDDQNKGKQPDQVRPTFQLRAGTQVGALGSDRFFVEILVRDTLEGIARPIKPVPNESGNAFVDIKGNQFYAVRVHNCDEFACVAKIRIDGQDAMNRFNADGVTYNGLLIEKGQWGDLKGWMHTTKPRPKEKDNVFAFVVREYGLGGPQAQKSSGEVGVITVQFAVAWKENEDRPKGRSIGRDTDKGPGLEQNFKVEKRHVGEFNETISIRYSPTAK